MWPSRITVSASTVRVNGSARINGSVQNKWQCADDGSISRIKAACTGVHNIAVALVSERLCMGRAPSSCRLI